MKHFEFTIWHAQKFADGRWVGRTEKFVYLGNSLEEALRCVRSDFTETYGKHWRIERIDWMKHHLEGGNHDAQR